MGYDNNYGIVIYTIFNIHYISVSCLSSSIGKQDSVEEGETKVTQRRPLWHNINQKYISKKKKEQYWGYCFEKFLIAHPIVATASWVQTVLWAREKSNTQKQKKDSKVPVD